MKTFVFVFLGLFASAPALGHEYWLAPSSYRARGGEALSVSAWVGTGFRGDRKLYARSRTQSMTLHAGKDTDLTAVSAEGDSVYARFAPPDDLGLLVSFVSNYTVIELPGAEFERYLALEGLDGAKAARRRDGLSDTPGRERYRRCVKTWVAGPAASSRVTKPLGLPFEIVPLVDPVKTQDVKLRVLFEGQPIQGVLVRAWKASAGSGLKPFQTASRDSLGPVAEARTKAGGEAVLHLSGYGEWLISAVHMTPCPPRAGADWQSTWASFTFGRPGGRD